MTHSDSYLGLAQEILLEKIKLNQSRTVNVWRCLLVSARVLQCSTGDRLYPVVIWWCVINNRLSMIRLATLILNGRVSRQEHYCWGLKWNLSSCYWYTYISCFCLYPIADDYISELWKSLPISCRQFDITLHQYHQQGFTQSCPYITRFWVGTFWVRSRVCLMRFQCWRSTTSIATGSVSMMTVLTSHSSV